MSEQAKQAEGKASKDSSALMERLGYLLGQAHFMHRSLADRALRPLGLRPKEFGALLILVKEGPMSQRALGERQRVDRTTTVAVVDELEGEDLVQRRPSAYDRRAHELHVTRKGRRVLTKALDVALRVEEDFLRPLSSEERRQFRKLLERLISS